MPDLDPFAASLLSIVRNLPDEELLALIRQGLDASTQRLDTASFCREHHLSPTETLVVELTTKGQDRKDIATKLQCSINTIGAYWDRILRKTGYKRSKDLIRMLMFGPDPEDPIAER